MDMKRSAPVFGAAWILTVALAAGGCGNGNRAEQGDENASMAPGGEGQSTAARGEEQASITLTGCLQQGDGSDFILTTANEPPRGVGTSGEAVESEQLKAARQAYRLSGEDDQMRGLVGHEVRVTGRVVDRNEVADDPERGDVGDRRDIDGGDLARVEVASLESVADACGSGSGRSQP